LPVLKIFFERFQKMTGLPRETIIDRLPYLGLDIEGEDPDSIRIEYNPNRPDFSTDYGIARALRGLMGTELGPPAYTVSEGRVSVEVDVNLSRVRPYIACAVAKGLRLDDETIRQLISMQEDLHNGIARRRRKAAIGLHNLDVIKPPLAYVGMPGSFEFAPLGSGKEISIDRVLRETETGKQYGHLVKDAAVFPILKDSAGEVLSFPPVINGTLTKVDTATKNLLIDVTSTEERVGDEALAIICAALSDAGGKLESVRVSYPREGKKVTPDLSPSTMKFDGKLASAITGLDLPQTELKVCLERSRLGLRSDGMAVIPRYRVDILHPVDLAEEVAIGYGLDRIEPVYPASTEPGSFHPLNVMLDRISESVAMSGFTETMSFDLLDQASLYTRFSRSSERMIEVENPRSLEHRLLRDSIIPSLMSALSRNVQAAYPQKVYEVGRVFVRGTDKIEERPKLAALTAHSWASYSEAKTYLEALAMVFLGKGLETRPSSHWAFEEGRCAEAMSGDRAIGHLGEVKASALAAFGVDVPVAGFEIDLAPFLQN